MAHRLAQFAVLVDSAGVHCRSMASTSQAQRDLDQRVVSSEPDAARVETVAELLPALLLRKDARVQTAYQAWRARTAAEAALGVSLPTALQRDAAHFDSLVRALGLQRYSWLSQRLFWVFAERALNRGTSTSRWQIEIRISREGLPPWSNASAGRSQKDGATHLSAAQRAQI